MIGKGLESLIPKKEASRQTQPAVQESSTKDYIFWIETEKIKPNPYQPRKDFDEEALNSLAESIKKYGLLQPIIVTKIEKKTAQGGIATDYQIVAGERRWRASKKVGLKQIPVIIKNPSSREKLEIALIENVQRKNLNAIDKAEAFDQLRAEFGLLEKEIAQVAGVSRETVANSLRMLSLPKEMRDALKSEKISEGHARALLAVKEDGLRKKVFEEILENSYTVRDTEKAARENRLISKTKSPVLAVQNKDFLEKRIKEVLGYDQIKIDRKRGKIYFTAEFANEEALKNWLKKIIHKG
ncbi:MAG: ParB/RepB/Spo0J family partition protein [Candidatus Pacebacteria bacterium]|nr:ParB/RepB/Spo0J family partition protein [Candidatus Paceibacterota bacterium]